MNRRITLEIKEKIKEIYITSYPSISLEVLAKKHRVNERSLYQISSDSQWKKLREEKQLQYAQAVHHKTIEAINRREKQKLADDSQKTNSSVNESSKPKSTLEKIAENRLLIVDLQVKQLDKVIEWQAANDVDPGSILKITQAIAKAGESIAKAHGDDITPGIITIKETKEVDVEDLRQHIKGYIRTIKD